MKFAISGADPEAAALANAADAAGHDVARQTSAASGGAAMESHRVAEQSERWEDLAGADAIIVGGGGDAELRVDEIRELVRLERPLLVVHPLTLSVISYFEIDMARTENRAILHHYNPLVQPGLVQTIANWVRDGHPQFGPVEQVAATRRLGQRTQERVHWHFARDVELLVALAGRLDRVAAHAPPSGESAAYAALSVQLLGSRQVAFRWSVEPGPNGGELSVVFVCQSGRVIASFDASDRLEQIEEIGGPDDRRVTPSTDSPPAIAIARFVAAVEARNSSESTWPAALDAMELADAIEISLRRGRMIDVHHRELTEQLAFKGIMSAVGCGVLLLLIPIVILASFLSNLAGAPFANYWPHALLAVLAAFLALQALSKFLFASRPDGDGND